MNWTEFLDKLAVVIDEYEATNDNCIVQLGVRDCTNNLPNKKKNEESCWNGGGFDTLKRCPE
jgi:hypothetical protein